MLARFFSVGILIVCASCATTMSRRAGSAATSVIHNNIVLLDPELAKFESIGPFHTRVQLDRDITLSLSEKASVDFFAPIASDKAPLVVICHGNYSGKSAHRTQAKMLATWGFNVVAFEVPNRGQWLENGARLKRLVSFLYKSPEFLGQGIDVDRIILAGHSFGGSASIVAMGLGAPVAGAVLLDPAVVHGDVIKAMRNIPVPVALLGSDKSLFQARGRPSFFRNIQGEMIEISVAGAVHDDAQGPSVFSKSALGFDPFTSSENQGKFRSLLTASVLSIASSGTLDFADRVIKNEKSSGSFRDYARRSQLQQIK